MCSAGNCSSSKCLRSANGKIRILIQGSTALHICAAEGHLEVARVLLNKRGGAATLLEAVDDEGRTALQVATSSGQKRVARLLKSRAPSNAEEL